MPEKHSWKDHYWYSIPVMRARIEKIIELASPRGKEIIEVGCNEGFVSKALLENHAKRVVPVDNDIEMCDRVTRIFGMTAIQGNINYLPFENKSFDVAIGSEVLEHITNPFKGLSELFRVAREKVIITVPVGEYWAGELTHQWMLFGGFINHENCEIYSADKNILILCFHRIRNEKFEDIAPFNTSELKARFHIN